VVVILETLTFVEWIPLGTTNLREKYMKTVSLAVCESVGRAYECEAGSAGGTEQRQK
jgi:hypothetical protein